MEEITAERKVQANAEAYSHMKQVQSHYIQSSIEQTLTELLEKQNWFFSNRLFLPGQFPDKWLAIRNGLQRLKRWEGMEAKSPDDKSKLDEEIDTLIEEAIDEIYKDMGQQKIVLSKSKATGL